MKFTLLETKEFIEDFNRHNSNTRHTNITPEVAEIFHEKTDGYMNSFLLILVTINANYFYSHIGFTCALTRGVQENSKGGIFDVCEWLQYPDPLCPSLKYCDS
jgi:hypothetical protein